MTDDPFEFEKNVNDTEVGNYFHEAMPSVVKRLLESCLTGQCFDHVDSTPMPALESILALKPGRAATLLQEAETRLRQRMWPISMELRLVSMEVSELSTM